MPSPPLVPDDGPIDIAHLKRMTLGDAGLEREVLAMFADVADKPGGAGGPAGTAQHVGQYRGSRLRGPPRGCVKEGLG